MSNNRAHSLGSGVIRKSKTEKGAPYWGNIRLTQEDVIALLAWAAHNEPQANNYGDPYYEIGLAAWVRDDREGGKYFSLALEQPYKSRRVDRPDPGSVRVLWGDLHKTFAAATATPVAAPAQERAAALWGAPAANDDIPF